MARVQHHRAAAIAQIGQSGDDGLEIVAAMRGEHADDIFQHNQPGRAAFGAHRAHLVVEQPEGAGAGFDLVARAAHAFAGASQRQVLTGEGSPGQIGAAGQVFRRDGAEISGMKIVAVPIGAVGFGLVGVDVIGEQAAPTIAKPSAGHAAAGEKFVKAERIARHFFPPKLRITTKIRP